MRGAREAARDGWGVLSSAASIQKLDGRRRMMLWLEILGILAPCPYRKDCELQRQMAE